MLQRFADPVAIAAEIERVRSLSGDTLRRRWRVVFGRSPPLQNKVEAAPIVSVMELSATGPTIRIKDLLVGAEVRQPSDRDAWTFRRAPSTGRLHLWST
jgi:hypothetical protein